jgi:malonyl-ACP O-methyltransferase BioC
MKLEMVRESAENTRLILIFAGWSCGPEIAGRVALPGWDVAVVHDFSELRLDTSFLDRYYTVYLFAWSLGVFAAELLLPAERITAAFALNGTLQPVSDTLGIPDAIYHGTLEGLNDRALHKFRLRMAGDKETFSQLGESSNRDIDNLRHQLANVADSQCLCGELKLPWVRAYISRNDRIFPFANMIRFWHELPDVEIVELDAAHYVPIEEIIGMVISDPDKVSRKFGKAAMSYDTHAIAQYSAAMKLADRLMAILPVIGGDVLEIGCGTGLFTHEYAPKVKARSITFVDITATGPFDVADIEEYVVSDAEVWIEKCERQYDMIVSASAIQWFADIPRFLHLCHERLKPGGILAISTFTPGNLGELDALRPSPLLYPKAADLRGWLCCEFGEVCVEEDEIKVEFRSAREVLMHLKHTGVGGSAPGKGLKIADMSHLRTLTYRPVYLTARKKAVIN